MKEFLNRLAWLTSFLAGYIISNIWGMVLSGSGFFRSGSDPEFSIFFLFFAGIFGLFIKKFVFPAELISNCLDERAGDRSVPLARKDDNKISNIPENTNPVEKATTAMPINVSQTEKAKSVLATITEPTISLAKNVVGQSGKKSEEPERMENREHGPNIFQRFFAENALAKIGSILLFLGVLFLLKLVYTVIGPIGKLMVGFSIGIILFIVGAWLEKKGHKKEGQIVIGTSILVNYLVILAGRYLIEESSEMGKMIFSEGITFFLLIMNTLIAILTSLAYRSNALLFFAFAVSYLNPFLIGAPPVTTPYSLAGYGLLISLGAMTVSVYLAKTRKVTALWLAHLAFLGGNIVILAAPFTLDYEWIIKLSCAAFLSIISIFLIYRLEAKKLAGVYFGVAYLFIFIHFLVGRDVLADDFRHFGILIGYLPIMLLMLGFSVYIYIKSSLKQVYISLFAPLLIFFILGLLGGLSLDQAIAIISSSMLAYLIIIAFISDSDNVSDNMKYAFFGSLGIFTFLMSFQSFLVLKTEHITDIGNLYFYGVAATVLIFLFFSYYFSHRKGLDYLYLIGTILSILPFLTILRREGEFLFPSIIVASVLFLSAALFPFINRRLLIGDMWNLVGGLVAGLIFSVYQIYFYMFGDKGYSQMTIGLAFLSLALFYFVLCALIYSLIASSRRDYARTGIEISKNSFYLFSGAAISVFSLAVAHIFSDKSGVVSGIWLFESALLYFLYQKTQEKKIYIFAFLLSLVGTVKLLLFAFDLQSNDYLSFIYIIFALATLLLSLKFLDKEHGNLRSPHDVMHIAGLAIIALAIMIVLGKKTEYGIFAMSIYALVLFSVYACIYSAKVKYVLPVFLFIVYLVHVISVGDILINDSKFTGPEMAQYFATLFFIAGLAGFDLLQKQFKEKNLLDSGFAPLVNIISGSYLFIISSQFLYYLLDRNVFVVSIYWGAMAFMFLIHGIHSEVIKYRTLGLYILSLAVIKIIIYDIWTGLDDAVMRVVALMVVGVIMIIASILYSRKYGSRLKGEFLPDNLFKS